MQGVISGRAVKPPRVVLYGKDGVGKTTWAAGADRPIFLPTEEGADEVGVDRFPLLADWSSFLKALGQVAQGEHDYGCVVVDSLDWLEPLIWQDVCQAHKVESIESLGYGKGYVEALTRWRMFCDGITALRDQKDMWVVMIAHSQVTHVEDPTQPAYDSHGLKMHKKAAAVIEEFSDVIGFANLKTMTISEDAGFNNKRTRAKTTGERVLNVAPNPAYTAKNRYSLPPTLPLDWSAFQQSIEQPTQQ